MQQLNKHLNLFGNMATVPTKIRATERGELLDYFLSEVNLGRSDKNLKPLNHSRISFYLQKIPTRDLYVLKSKMEQARRKGYPAGAIFWLEVKPH